MVLIRPPKTKIPTSQPSTDSNLSDSKTTSGGSGTSTSAVGLPKTASLLPATTNAEAGVYDVHANQGRGALKTATKEYGAEAVRLLGMIAPCLRSSLLTDKDRVFVTDMFGKMNAYGSGFVASQGQVHWLRDLKDRLLERGEL